MKGRTPTPAGGPLILTFSQREKEFMSQQCSQEGASPFLGGFRGLP